MNRCKLLFSTLLLAAIAPAQTLLDSFTTADRAYAGNQQLTGTWLAEGRRASPPGTPVAPASPVFYVFHSDGTMTGSTSVGADSAFSGVWTRVGDGKFLVTYCVFNYGPDRSFLTIAKIRMVTRISADGQKLQGTQEAVVVDGAGKVQFTASGGTHNMVRIVAEKPADFEDFLSQE